MDFKCLLCGAKISSDEIVSHLSKNHHLSFREYYEISKLGEMFLPCWKCGQPRVPVSPLSNKYYLPCWGCLSTKKSDRKEAYQTTLFVLKDYQKDFLDNRIVQYLLADSKIMDWSLTHNIHDVSSLLSDLRIKKDGLFYVTTIPGSPKEISLRNKENIRIIYKDTPYIKLGKITNNTIIIKEGYRLHLPDICDYDVRHHSRYSILNLKATRNVKKIKLGSDCIRFWNTDWLKVKSICKITNYSNEPVELDEEDLLDLKILIFRNKPLMKRILDVYNEICRLIRDIDDRVFLKNTLYLGPMQQVSTTFSFSWLAKELSEKTEGINISIL